MRPGLLLAACLGSCAAPSELEPVVERFRPALSIEGDAARGAELYRKSCLQCHRAGGEGYEAGPDLTAFRGRSPGQLLVDILDPNREVRTEYASHRILTKDGRLVEGLLVTEDATGVTLRRAQGERETVAPSEIEKRIATGLSLMPESYHEGLELQQLADLLAFIRQH